MPLEIEASKMKVGELRKSLINMGVSENRVTNLAKKELVKLYEQLFEESVVNLDIDKDFEEVIDSSPLGAQDEKEESDETPRRISEEWHNYVMSQFKPNELIDGNPITAGLRRVVEVVLGEIMETGPVQIFPATDSDGPGRATVVYRVVSDEYESGRVKSYSDVADVWHGNTDDLFCAHPVATASTRAEGRALRKALKLRVLAAEELAKKDIVNIVQQTTQRSTDGNWNPDDRISSQQINFIDNKCKQLDIDVYLFINIGELGYSSIEEVNKDTAKNMIVALNQYQTQTQEIPESIQGYRSDWRN